MLQFPQFPFVSYPSLTKCLLDHLACSLERKKIYLFHLIAQLNFAKRNWHISSDRYFSCCPNHHIQVKRPFPLPPLLCKSPKGCNHINRNNMNVAQIRIFMMRLRHLCRQIPMFKFMRGYKIYDLYFRTTNTA